MLKNVHTRVTLISGDEIVGAMIGTIITNDPYAIKERMKSGQDITLLTRREMKFMDAADLGINWHKLAIGSALITIP